MMNPFTEVNWNPDRAGRKKFALSLLIGFPCLAAVLLLVGHFTHGRWKPGLIWLGAIGAGLGLVFWLLPGIARPFYVVWYFIGCCIGFVMGNLMLSLFFYVVITLVGWIMGALGRRSLAKGFDRSKATYWDDGHNKLDSKAYYRQF
jgi:hypothetical protein